MNDQHYEDRKDSGANETQTSAEAQDVLTTPPTAEEIKRRAQLILESRKPEWIFSIAKKTERSIEWCTFRKPPSVFAVLLFTSQTGAKDYVSHTGVDFRPVAMKAEDVLRNATNWAAAGLTGFAMNRCPRCNFIQTFGIQMLLNPQGLQTAWAMALAMQQLRAEKQLQLYMREVETPQGRAHLEYLRDHIDCSSPYIHQLIALRARMEADEKTVELSLERLVEFGPEFALGLRETAGEGDLAEQIVKAERAAWPPTHESSVTTSHE